MSRPPVFPQDGASFKDIPLGSNHVDKLERMGVMSLTLSSNPVVHSILPARIRCRRHNDVVFVGSTFIQLREFTDNGQLSDTTAKLDFATTILNAKVISAKAEMVPMLDKILDQEWDEERFLIKGEPCKDGQPPQIIVLFTQSNELIYVYARNSSNNKNVEFVYAKRALLADASLSERGQRHMAIDPECKIMAVASGNVCTVFSLKEVDDLKESIDAWDPRRPQSFQPNHEQRMIKIDGYIHRMDFLRASKEEPEKTILLFIVATKDNGFVPLFYSWDTRKQLNYMQPMSGVIRSLRQDEKFPVMLIPMQKHTTFAIVTETNIFFYTDIRLPSIDPIPIPLPSEPQAGKKLIWNAWAKPSRHDRYSNEVEDVFLIREDGLLYVLNRSHAHASKSVLNYSPGRVGIATDHAVCLLPGPRLMGGDILIVAGSMCDGGVFHVAARQEINMLQIIPNVSPVLDATSLTCTANKQGSAKPRRTYVTAGQLGSSDLSELRYGYEAQIGWTVPFARNETISRLYTLEQTATKTLFILASHLEHTTAVALDLEKQQLEEIDPELYPALKLDTVTLAAEMLKSQISVQITSKCVSAGFETNMPVVENISNCVSADIDFVRGTFAIACKIEDDYHIKVGIVNELDGHPSILLSPSHYSSIERPLCLALFYLADNQYLSVGYPDGQVEVFSIDMEGRLISEEKFALNQYDHTPVTSVVVFDYPNVSRALFLAGTRDGKLHVMKVSRADGSVRDSINITLDRTYQIGDTQVAVVEDRGSRGSNSLGALVQCGSRLDQIVCHKHSSDIDYMLVHVWLTTRNDLTYTSPNLIAVQRIRDLHSIEGGDPSRFIMCATKEDVLFARLVEQEQIIPRRFNSDRNGGKLLAFSELLNKFVIAGNADPNVDGLTNADSNLTYPSLRVVDPDQAGDDDEYKIGVKLGEYYDKVQVLMPWEPTDGKSHYNLIMVGLNNMKHGQLGFVSARKLSEKSNTVSFKMLVRFQNRRLHTICAVEKSSLAISAGNDLLLLTFDIASRQWHRGGQYTFPSPAVSLSAQGTVIYAATQSHSLIVLNWRKATATFDVILTDSAAKDARAVVPFGKNGDHLLMTTVKDGGTSILAYSMKRNSMSVPSPLFEVQLPLTVQCVVSASSSWTERPQYAFQAISFDGTIYMLATLSYSEWRLLHFIVQLAQPEPAKSAKKQIALLTEKMARNFIRLGKEERLSLFNPRNMHVNGDVIKGVVDKGPEHLRYLLGGHVKHEDDMNVDRNDDLMSKLEALAKPVLGKHTDLLDEVIAWSRRMLRSTIF